MMDGWNPIETAPMDGTTILGWSSYSEVSTYQYRGGPNWTAVSDGEAVIENQGDCFTNYKDNEFITHWMPLPPPPENSNG